MHESSKTLRSLIEFSSIKSNFKTKCSHCGHWNRIPVNKIFLEQPSPEAKVQVLINTYEPLEVIKYKKSGKAIAEPKEYSIV